MTFYHRATLAAGTGQLPWGRGALTGEACRGADGENLLGRRLRGDRLNCLGAAHGENATRRKGLTPSGVMDAEGACHRVDLAPLWRADTGTGAVDLVEQGQHRAGIARSAWRYWSSNDKARGRFRHTPRLAPQLGGAMALALEAGGDGRIVRSDDFAVAELLAVGEPPRWLADRRRGTPGRRQLHGQAFALGSGAIGGLLTERLGLLPKHGDGLAEGQERSFGLAHQGQEDAPLPPALAAKPPPDLFPLLVQALGLGLQLGGLAAASLSDAADESKGFFAPCPAWWQQCPGGGLVPRERYRRPDGQG